MRKKQLQGIPKDIEKVRVRFEHWRKTRQGRRSIPEELWQAAVSLTQKHSLVRVAKYLRLNHSKLKERAEKASMDSSERAMIPVEKPLPENLSAPFIELHPGTLFTPQSSLTVVELRGTDGESLTIHLPPEAVDLLGLANAFWRRS